jgi:TonB family protein
MRLFTAAVLLIAGALAAQTPPPSEDWKVWLERGTREFKQARYAEAAESFEKAVALRPEEVQPHLYLGTAWMNQYIPGAATPENVRYAQRAETEFRRVLELEPNHTTALDSLASLDYLQAQGMQDEAEKAHRLEAAQGWYEALVRADPAKKEAYYSLGVIAWAQWYPQWNAERVRAGMRPDARGPLPDPAARLALKNRFATVVADGMRNLNRALELDPQYDDAMAYLNLLVREWADVADTQEDYTRQVAQADEWVNKALAIRASRAEAGAAPGIAPGASQSPQPPLPPPPPAPASQPLPQRISIGAAVQERALLHKVEPVYPALARQARIRGTVRFTVIIAKDGHVLSAQLVSGHPLLVTAAQEAVSQWVYRPTLLNGQPVEVVTNVDVNFALESGPPGIAPSTSDHAATGDEPRRIPNPRPDVAYLIYRPKPVYPQAAREAHIQGTVLFSVVMGTDGHVSDIKLISGHPLLVDAARENVAKWIYRPAIVNGDPVRVHTELDVHFSLNQ